MAIMPDDLLPARSPAEPPTTRSMQAHLLGVLGTTAVLALLYFGRDVLIPVTLALMLAILVAPLIRRLQHIGLSHTAAVWASVAVVVLVLTAIGTVIGTQLIRMGASLPQYEETIRTKLTTLDRMTLGRMGQLIGPVQSVIDRVDAGDTTAHVPVPNRTKAAVAAPASTPLQVEIHQSSLRPLQVLSRALSLAWGPLASTSIVIVVLIFALLEQEALRDRFIRLIGGNDLRATTVAVNDAGERVAHFFAYQFAVNFSVGVVIWAGLTLLGNSQALLWGTLAGLLRIVPYVGLWIAAACATLFAAAVEPGWSVAVMTLGLFGAVEFIVSQLVEPFLYSRTAGLSPLSVVIAAIFWSWIWGPVGLVLSTPLTLCLVVAGRYVKALNALEILLGEVPALTLSQNFYQRTLSGNAASVIERAKVFIKNKSFAAYCDAALVPAMYMARQDIVSGAISRADQRRFRQTMANVIEALSGPRRRWRRPAPISVLADVNLARQLRAHRELHDAEWATKTHAGGAVLCVGVGSIFNELATEVLVRVLAQARVDGHHLLADDQGEVALYDVDSSRVAAICLVSQAPGEEVAHIETLAQKARASMPDARILALILEAPFSQCDELGNTLAGVDLVAHSYVETLDFCLTAVGAKTARGEKFDAAKLA